MTRRIAWRRTEVLRWSFVGPTRVFGAFVRGAEGHPIVESHDGISVADARIDAVRAEGAKFEAAGAIGSDATALLAEVLQRRGVEALDDVAGDFAFARFDGTRLLLARDAFAMRPLFWARRGDTIGFACEPEILLELGLADGELDRDSVAAFLLGDDLPHWRSPFASVWRVPGGRWVSLGPSGSGRGGRWFRPERIRPRRLDLDAAADLTRGAILDAVRSRARGGVSVLLSGGRDSGTVATALGDAGVAADCLTFQVTSGLGSDETVLARTLALESGHRWRAIPVSASINEHDLEVLPTLNGPFGPPVFPYTIASLSALAGSPSGTAMEGIGGEPLFGGPPLVLEDLARRGMLGAVTEAARTFHRDWTFSYATQAKWLVRAHLPASLLATREAHRPSPPWVVTPSGYRSPYVRAHSSRDYLLRALTEHGHSVMAETTERVLQRVDTAYVAPLLDLRVVSVALSLPDHLRAPVPEAKPVLARAFLGPRARTRTKGRYVGIVDALAEEEVRLFPGLRRTGRLLAKLGYVSEPLPSHADVAQWSSQVLRLLPLELWLRRRTDGDG